MSKELALRRISEIGILPVIRASSTDEARQVIAAIEAGGITTIEVTLTTPGAVELIRELSKRENLMVGAGTVLDKKKARECIDAGAQFIISPSFNLETVRLCNEAGVVVMPGALTPTEIVNAWDAGADVVKVFPCGAMGGAGYIKSIKAPLPHIKLIPTGGVTLSNAASFIEAGAEAVGVGADLVDLDAIRSGDAAKITRAAKEYLHAVSGVSRPA